MIPIRDDNPHVLTPYTTCTLIGLNVLSWIFLQGLGVQSQLAASICQYALVPGQLLGTLDPGSTFQVAPGAVCQTGTGSGWYTLVTSMFMHGGWLHVIGNMWFLWIFGNNVEDAMGHVRFAIFYLLCGLAAAALQLFFTTNPAVPMVGASGAIGGVMGAYILLYPRVQVHMLVILGFFVTVVAVPAVLMLGYWFALQLLGGFASMGAGGGGVAFWAHVGGFVAGGLMVFLFRDPKLLRRHPFYGWKSRSPGRSWRRVSERDRDWFEL